MFRNYLKIALRKVLGSVRGQLVKQFLSESVLLAFLAFFIAIVLIDLLLPAFNRLAGKELALGFSTNRRFFFGLIGVTLLTGLLAGLYPAFVLSAFQPVAVLKGALRSGSKSPWLRSTLVVVQFAISIILLVGTGVVIKQLEFMRNKRLGFNQEQVVVLPIETRAAQQSYEAFRQQLLENPNVVEVAASSVVPGRFEGDNAYRPEGAPPEVVYPKDFHLESMHLPIKPVVMFIAPSEFQRLVVRIRPQNIPATLAFLQEKWQAYEPGYPFRYFFLDEDFGRLFQNEAHQSRIFGDFTILAIFIACLGLFGLAAFIAEQRTKEIGVRKVLGASERQIVVLLPKDFTTLVGLAFIIAAPVAYFVMNRWLQDFAYRTKLDSGIFLLTGALALVIAWLTVSYQAIKAALANPVEALRYE